MKRAWRWMMSVGVVGITALSMSRLALADSSGGTITLCDPLGSNCSQGSETFQSIATAVAGFLFWDIVLPISTIMVLVGAFQLITSGGSPEKVSKGRKTLLYAAVGVAVAIIAGGITQIIQNFVQQAGS